MTRPKANTIDFFQHDAHQGRTITILKSLYGAEGYAFWFQLLEILASTENHFLTIYDQNDLDYLASRTGISPELSLCLLNKLASLSAICPVLLRENIIWSQNLVDRVQNLYRENRKREPPSRPIPARLSDKPARISLFPPVLPAGNPQSKVKDKVKDKEDQNLSVKPGEDLLDSQPGKETTKVKRDKQPRSLAVIRFHEITDTWPNRIQIEAIDQVVITDVDVDLWEAILKHWRLKNYNPTNVHGMLDMFKNGIPKRKGGDNGKQVGKPDDDDDSKWDGYREIEKRQKERLLAEEAAKTRKGD